jgi:hypothetical protein
MSALANQLHSRPVCVLLGGPAIAQCASQRKPVVCALLRKQPPLLSMTVSPSIDSVSAFRHAEAIHHD